MLYDSIWFATMNTLYFAVGLLLIVVLWVILYIRRENRTDWGGPWLNFLDGINRVYCKKYHGLKSDSLLLPEQGPALVVANHISGLDPMAMIAASHRPLRFIIAAEQYNRFGLKRLFREVGCIPVDREKRPERAMREAIRCLRSGEVVALFPQGGITVSAEEKTELKAGVVRLAKIIACPIIPIHIDGVNGIGHVFRCLIFPGKIKISSYEPIRTEDFSEEEILQTIGRLIKHH